MGLHEVNLANLNKIEIKIFTGTELFNFNNHKKKRWE